MPPKVKYKKEEIVSAAADVLRKKGYAALTAREVASELGVSTRPIFTYFESMEDLRREVYALAKETYRSYLERGLSEEIPFLGLWKQYVRFAREEREFYRLLFLTKPGGAVGGAADALKTSQDLARPSLMRVYRMDGPTADRYFRDMWLTAFSFCTLIVTEDCPFGDDEIFSIGTEISLSLCKAFKEVPGLAEGNCDTDAVFSELVKKQTR